MRRFEIGTKQSVEGHLSKTVTQAILDTLKKNVPVAGTDEVMGRDL